MISDSILNRQHRRIDLKLFKTYKIKEKRWRDRAQLKRKLLYAPSSPTQSNGIGNLFFSSITLQRWYKFHSSWPRAPSRSYRLLLILDLGSASAKTPLYSNGSTGQPSHPRPFPLGALGTENVLSRRVASTELHHLDDLTPASTYSSNRSRTKRRFTCTFDCLLSECSFWSHCSFIWPRVD